MTVKQLHAVLSVLMVRHADEPVVLDSYPGHVEAQAVYVVRTLKGDMRGSGVLIGDDQFETPDAVEMWPNPGGE